MSNWSEQLAKYNQILRIKEELDPRPGLLAGPSKVPGQVNHGLAILGASSHHQLLRPNPWCHPATLGWPRVNTLLCHWPKALPAHPELDIPAYNRTISTSYCCDFTPHLVSGALGSPGWSQASFLVALLANSKPQYPPSKESAWFWHKTRHVHQYNRAEDSEVGLCNDSHLIFFLKESKNTVEEKIALLTNGVWKKLHIYRWIDR